MGAGKKKIPPQGGKVAGKADTSAAKTGTEEMGLVDRLMWLQKTAGNVAVSGLVQGMKTGAGQNTGQATQPAPFAAQGICKVGKAEDPWDPWSPECRSVNERWGKFWRDMDAIHNQDVSYEEKMQVWGTWNQYLTGPEFEKIQNDNYWVKAAYDKYLKFYNLDRPGQPHDLNFSVSFGDSAADRAEMAGNTLENITGSIGGAIFYGIAHLFTDDPVKLNAASGMGAGVTNMGLAHGGAIEQRNANPVLRESQPEITTPVKKQVENTSGPSFTMAGKGYSTWGFSLNVDEPLAVGEPGITPAESMRRARDLSNRQFLDFMTNQATKGEKREVPSSARSAPDLSPVSVKDKPSALLTRPSLKGIQEWDTFAAEVMAKKSASLSGKTASQVKEALNKEIVEQLKNPKSPSAKAISKALSDQLGLPAEQLFRKVKVGRVPAGN